MTDLETQKRFVELRALGWSFSRISTELNLSKPTLIDLGRKLQFEIQNARAVELEDLKERWLSTREERLQMLGRQLKVIESELMNRDLSALPTSRLFSLAASLRKQIQADSPEVLFTTPTNEIPKEDYVDKVQDWKA